MVSAPREVARRLTHAGVKGSQHDEGGLFSPRRRFRRTHATRASLGTRAARDHRARPLEQFVGHLVDTLGETYSARNPIEKEERRIEVGRPGVLFGALVAERLSDVAGLAHEGDGGDRLESSPDAA